MKPRLGRSTGWTGHIKRGDWVDQVGGLGTSTVDQGWTDLLSGEQDRPRAQLADLPCSATKLKPGFTTELACSLPLGT